MLEARPLWKTGIFFSDHYLETHFRINSWRNWSAMLWASLEAKQFRHLCSQVFLIYIEQKRLAIAHTYRYNSIHTEHLLNMNAAADTLVLEAPAISAVAGAHPSILCDPEIMPLKALSTFRGILFNGDCIEVLPHIHDETVDTIFADPPFNLSKTYGVKVNDDLSDRDYIEWCKL
ncbi:MAG: hypothetical protein PHW60_10965 [Kiritimatiellae bacterium]|nr:hypothetical protein [Kiritimatiellia bacterium]